MLKVELHTHTADDPVDHISHSTVELIDRASTLGYDAIAVTLHDRQLDIASLERYAEDRHITLIPGIERSIEGRHVLLLNFSTAAEGVQTFDDLARLRSREAGLVIAPHPFFPSRSSLFDTLERHADLFDAVEYNAMYTASVNFNRRAERWAAARGKPIVGNCDVHRLSQLGTTYSVVDADARAESICDAIRAGRVEVKTRALSWAEVVSTLGSMFATDLSTRMRHSTKGRVGNEADLELTS